jgi:hypothetical protein
MNTRRKGRQRSQLPIRKKTKPNQAIEGNGSNYALFAVSVMRSPCLIFNVRSYQAATCSRGFQQKVKMSFTTLRSRAAVLTFVQVGLFLDNLFHVYRFHKIGWTSITGIIGQPQSIILSYGISIWALLPLFFCRRIAPVLGKGLTQILAFAAVALLLNQIAGRSVLKGMFDIMLLAILFGWELIEDFYARNRDHLKTDTQLQLIHSELMNLFQTTVVVLTFVISTFGFRRLRNLLFDGHTVTFSGGTLFVLLAVWTNRFMALRLGVQTVVETFLQHMSWERSKLSIMRFC